MLRYLDRQFGAGRQLLAISCPNWVHDRLNEAVDLLRCSPYEPLSVFKLLELNAVEERFRAQSLEEVIGVLACCESLGDLA